MPLSCSINVKAGFHISQMIAVHLISSHFIGILTLGTRAFHLNLRLWYPGYGILDQRPGGGTWIQNDGGVHAYDSFCEPALEKIAKNHTRH